MDELLTAVGFPITNFNIPRNHGKNVTKPWWGSIKTQG
jgi:hypothetical protein